MLDAKKRNPVSWLIRLLYERTILVLGAMFCFAVAGVLWHVDHLQSNLVETLGLQDAARYSLALEEFRTLYTSEVVGAVQRHGIEVTHDYKERDGAIPLPATLSMLLGESIADHGSGVTMPVVGGP